MRKCLTWISYKLCFICRPFPKTIKENISQLSEEPININQELVEEKQGGSQKVDDLVKKEISIEAVDEEEKQIEEDAPKEKQQTQRSSKDNLVTRRTRIPNRPPDSSNTGEIILNLLRQRTTRISLPVNVCEPISFLQRLAETFEYSHLLDEAAKCDDLFEQTAYVAAFSITVYAETDRRLGKPFNPLLGETFEFDRTTDLGWRYISEQVANHPPTSVFHCEGKNWTCISLYEGDLEFSMSAIAIKPEGYISVQFHKTGSKYTWNRVTTKVRNIIFGKIYMEHSGIEKIIGNGRAENIRSEIKFFPRSSGRNEHYNRIEGKVLGPNDETKYFIHGYWNRSICISSLNEENNNQCRIIWIRNHIIPGSEKYYNFSIFACQLNEPDPEVAPTDSRFRPDQRLLELGDYTEAGNEKQRLEVKQRNARSIRQNLQIEARPAWFNSTNDDLGFSYSGDYWKCKQVKDWSRCADIF